MRSLLTLFGLFCVSFICNGQQQLTLVLPETTIELVNQGKPFMIQLNFTSTECTSSTIVLNIGTLSYYEPYTSLPAGAVLTNNQGILTISNITNGTGGVIQSLSIWVQFVAGTCNNIPQTITATLASNGCSTNLEKINAVPITVSPNNNNNATVKITKSTLSQQEPVYVGNTVRYTIEATNGGSGLMNNTKLFLDVPLCVIIAGLYEYNTYTSVDRTETSDGTKKAIEWNSPDIKANSKKLYDLYITYPCDNKTSTNCNLSLNNFNVYLKGTLCNSEIVTTPSTLTEDLNKPLPDSVCLSGNGLADDPKIVLTSAGSNLVCPTTACNGSNPSANFNISISPGSKSYPSLTYTVTIPLGLKATFVKTNNVVPCMPVITYYDSGGKLTQLINLARSIRWTFGCEIITPINLNGFEIYFVYDKPKLPSNSELLFSHTITSGTTSVLSLKDQKVAIASCKPSIDVNTYVKKATPTSFNTTNVFGNALEIFTYTLTIRNPSSQQATNTLIKDVLDSAHAYAGNLKYAYTANSAPNTYTNIAQNNKNILIPELGTATINHTANEVSFEGFNFPAYCNTINNILSIQFDVQLNSNVVAGAIIKNEPFVTQNSVTFPSKNFTTIGINSYPKVSSEMLVKCAKSDDWVKSIYVKNGEDIGFKMRFINEGTKSAVLKELLNLKPQLGDLYEFGSAPRNSSFTINYNCSNPPKISSNKLVPTAEIFYSNNNVTMDRTMLCPATTPTPNNAPLWDASCSAASNWLKVDFMNGYTLLPGDYVEIEYSGTATGEIGSLINAYNSFASKVDDNGSCTTVNSNVVTIINDGLGCDTFHIAPCFDCASFDLIKKEKYVVSGWIKESNPTVPLEQYKNYDKGSISVAFTDIRGNLIDTALKFYASGAIIDGWQRIIGEFLVPENVDDMQLELLNESTDAKIVYFDDIRVLPTKGNMKSFVYDQKTQRLMAELDENNYSTFYEYDLEGGLIRIKKETEKGVYTIQETRSSNAKPKN